MKQYYKNKDFCLYQGDSLEIIKTLPENYVDMVFADPPYFLTNNPESRSYKGNWDLSSGVKKDFLFHMSWIGLVRRVMKPEATIWVTGTHHNIHQCGMALQLLGFEILNDITWYKPTSKFGDIRSRFNFSHESVIWAKKSKIAKHYLNPIFCRQKSDKFHTQGLQMPTVWDIKPCSKQEINWHPTPKPEALLERIIKASCKEGGIILDPFNGSGTTGIVCQKLGQSRKYIGIDMDKNYLDKTIKRLNLSKLKQLKTR